MKKILIILSAVLVCSGCATAKCRIPALTDIDIKRDVKGPYPAVQLDGGFIGWCTQEGGGAHPSEIALLGLCVMVDIPISFTIDTICMPYDLSKYCIEKHRKQRYNANFETKDPKKTLDFTEQRKILDRDNETWRNKYYEQERQKRLKEESNHVQQGTR